MLRVLLKKQLTEIFRNSFYNSNKNKAYSKCMVAVNIALFVFLMVGVIGGMFTFLSVAICSPMADVGMGWLYFSIMGMLAILFGIFGSVFSTYSSLYLAKDNDLLLSMPIPVSVLMVSRLLSVYVMGLMYSASVVIPAVIVYWIMASATFGDILGGLLFLFLISVFVMTLSCLLGWVVAKVSVKLKRKSFITVLISLVFIGLYYFIYFKAQELVGQLINNAVIYGEAVIDSAYPIYLFGRVAVGDPVAALIVSAVIIAFFVLLWFVLSRSFLKIATSSGSEGRKAYKEKKTKRKGVFAAVLGKEFKRFTSSPNYMLNCGLGALFLIIAGVGLILKGSTVISALNEIFGSRPGSVEVLLSAGFGLIISMVDTAAPSVSLEGRSLWIVQSLPVLPWQVLRAKLYVQLILSAVPTIFCIFCLALIYPLSMYNLLLIALTTMSFVLLNSLFGMFLAVKMPNLTWTNETTPIKQSAAVFFSMFGGFLYSILLGIGFMVLPGWKLGASVYMLSFSALTLALSALLYCWLKKGGSKAFARL